MLQLLRTKLWVVLLLSACATEVKVKPVPRSEATAGARAANGGKGTVRRPLRPVCVNGEMSVPHSPTDPCPQDDPACRAVGGTAFASCEGGTWGDICVCNVPQTPPATCGDGVIQSPTEQCDRAELNQATCLHLGFRGGGALRCNATTCQYDTQMCRS